jgi:hypothetical protein
MFLSRKTRGNFVKLDNTIQESIIALGEYGIANTYYEFSHDGNCDAETFVEDFQTMLLGIGIFNRETFLAHLAGLGDVARNFLRNF